MYKNKADQIVAVYAWNTTSNAPETGDAANITGRLSLDGGSTAATNDTNPTELDATNNPGVYLFSMLQAETNGDLFVLSAKSVTANVTLEPIVLYTIIEAGQVSVGSSGVSTSATTAVVTTGSQTGTYSATKEADGAYHQIADVGGTTDMYYEFYGGTNGVPISVTLLGRSNGLNDDLKVYGYNFGATSWEQIGTLEGKVQSVDDEITFSMLDTHVGSGVDAGKIRVRFFNTGLTAAVLHIDQISVAYSVVASNVGYANGSIWLDTVNGTAGAVADVNGVGDLPCNSWADALTLVTLKNLHRIHVAQGSTITLPATTTNLEIYGTDYTINLASREITNCVISGAILAGIAIGNGGTLHLNRCTIGDVTLPEVTCVHCAYTGTITLGEPGNYIFEAGFSAVAGESAPIWDFGAAIGNCGVSFRHASGGYDFRNVGQAGTDSISLEGVGQYILNANCIGGSLSVRGNFQKTDNTGGAVTIYEQANFVDTVIHSGFAQGSGVGDNQIQLSPVASSMDGAYDPAEVFILTGTGAGQSRLIYQYSGVDRIATVDRNWKIKPDTTSQYRVMPSSGREHVNEGLARAGTINTIQLNALASTEDGAYVRQLVFIRSGTGEDQVVAVDSYDGLTQTAVMSENWTVIPDGTSGYAILPAHVIHVEEVQEACDAAITANADIDSVTDKLPSSPYLAGSETSSGIPSNQGLVVLPNRFT